MALAPAVESLANVYAGEITVGKVNVDENPEVSMRYQVRGIPAVTHLTMRATALNQNGSVGANRESG